MSRLEELREEIDRIDGNIIELFEKRMQCAKEVAQYKQERGMQVLDSSRERQVLEQREKLLRNKGLSAYNKRLFLLLMELSRAYQRCFLVLNEGRQVLATNDMVVFQGEPGANSQAALVCFFGKDVRMEHYATFEQVFQAVNSGKAGYGVIPIENSYTGSIAAVYDLLHTYQLQIVGEQYLKIDHKLLGVPGAKLENVTDVYSHEQALMQCAGYLKAKQFSQHPYYNTAASAKFVAETGDKTKAAIASGYAARLYGLDILEDDISVSAGNTTRFIIVAKNPYTGENADKVSVCFVLDHQPGALANALQFFAQNGLNMVKIESRPLVDRNFEYMFYVDFAGGAAQKALAGITEKNSGVFREFTVLGAYPGGEAE
ncbi:chorismate mutase [Christensenellaceae bacterium OttesenSCG-928-K19]|nr:chorismate mutase [Christensenellaceae bacterium OttesenSCG-928-K19]